MIIPEKLRKGDKAALLGGSGPVSEFSLEQMEQAVRDMGLEPVSYPSASARHGYLAGDDQMRARDIMSAFCDPEIKGILTIRGGYGFARILPLLDFEEIRKHPKFFMGYSDVTAMHTALNQKADLATMHMIMVSAWLKDQDEYTMEQVRKALFEDVNGELKDPQDYPERKTLVSGKGEGILCGGNLTLLSQSLGTPWEIDTKGRILFIEETDEPWWKIDGMINQLRNAGKLKEASGIVFGSWNHCGEDADPERTLDIDEILKELVIPEGTPCFKGIACGHSMPSMVLPLGRKAVLDADHCSLCILD